MLTQRTDVHPHASARLARCSACGRRIASACPQHGAPVEPANDEVDASFVRGAALPLIRGYQTARVVARGGFGLVLEATRERDGKRVAVKVARREQPRAHACLVHEVGVLRRIGPPCVPEVFDEGRTEDGTPYVAMEYIDAATLAHHLVGRSAPPSVEEAGAMVRALLAALEVVHAHGYVHRDLKPENVFVIGRERARLVDFGLAALPEDVANEAIGTAEYMAPEQCEGRSDIDHRADLYAVGVILFELLAGRPPFWGPRALVLESHRSRQPPRVAAAAPGLSIPAALEEVVARCLAKDRGDRFSSAVELSTAIATALSGSTPAPREQERPPPLAPASTRGERLTVAALFFESAADVATVQKQLASLGGQLGRASGAQFVAIFGAETADNPVQRAADAGEALVRGGSCTRVRVDLASVSVQTKRDGSRRFVGADLARTDRFPSAGEPPGVHVTPEAAAMLRDAVTPSTPREREHDTESMFGRDALLAAIVESALAVERGGPATIVSVTGDAGTGKSHLARALTTELSRRAPHVGVLAIHPREPVLGDVDHALRALLLHVLDLSDARPADGGAALLRERLEPFGQSHMAPAVALALGWLAPGSGSALRALDAAPGALRSALTVIAGEALRRRAAKGPSFIVLDDAHFAGDAVLAALEYSARAEAGAPLWICVLGRPVLDAERPGWGDGAGTRTRHHLGPLDGASAAALCRRLLLPAESVPEDAVRRIVERAEANPLLLTELVRGLHRAGIVRRSSNGASSYVATDELDDLPDLPLIEWAAQRELEALGPSLRSHARLVALLGEDVTTDDIESLIRTLRRAPEGLDLPLDAKVALQRLAGAGTILVDDAGRVRFRHALVREAMLRTVPERQRRQVHLAAARHYAEQPDGDVPERRLAQLAWHADEAGLADDAAAAYFILARQAQARHAYTEAERLYSRALTQAASPGALDRRAAYRGRGSMRYRIGRHHDALADLGAARALATDDAAVGERIEILLDEATALDWMDAHKESAERVEEALALSATVSAEACSPMREARLLLGRGRAAFRSSRNEEAALLLERAATAAELVGDDGYETLVIALIQLAFLLPGLGRVEDARAAIDRVVAQADKRGDQLHLGSALNVRGLLWANLGDKARFAADMERSLAIARALGHATLEMFGEFNFSEYLLLMDEPVDAEAHFRRAQALDRRITGDPGLGNVALLDARLRFYRGDEVTAAAQLAALRARQAEARVRGEQLLAPSDDVLCSAIELALRDAPSDAWDALEERSIRFSVGQERIEVLETRGVAAAKRGRLTEARAHLTRAAALASSSPSAMRARVTRRIDALLEFTTSIDDPRRD